MNFCYDLWPLTEEISHIVLCSNFDWSTGSSAANKAETDDCILCDSSSSAGIKNDNGECG